MSEARTYDRAAIERRAYEIYCARGCVDGNDLDDWLAAEESFRGEVTAGEVAAKQVDSEKGRRSSASTASRRNKTLGGPDANTDRARRK